VDDLPVFRIEGTRVTSLEAFWVVIGEAVNGPGGYFGRNLDALNDCSPRWLRNP
jgi:RNAse (barnase) inhibitor barstar